MTFRFLLVLALLLPATAGCLPFLINPAPPAPQKAELIALDQLPPADYPEEISRLEKIILSPAATAAEKTAARHRLALLYLLPDSPLRDLRKGAAALQIHLEQLPNGPARLETSLILELLQDKLTLERNLLAQEERRKRETTALETERQQLTRQVRDLTTSNAKLGADIEKLKMIDLSVEKKRKNFR